MAASEAGEMVSARTPDGASRHDVLSSGLVCGLAAGIAMLAVVTIAAALQGVPVSRPLAALGGTFVGPEALPGAARIVFGLLVHLATSAALGIAFAAVVPRDTTVACGMGVGLGFALVAVAIMMMTVVPRVNPGFREGIAVVGGSWVIGTAVFGAVVGLAPAVRRRLAGRSLARREDDAADRRGGGGVPVAPRPRTT